MFPLLRRFFSDTVPVFFRPRFIPSWASSSLQSTSCLSPARPKPDSSSRVSFLFATSASEVHHMFDRFPHPPGFRPQRFSRSRRLTPPDTLWAYFIPPPRPGFHSRGFSRCSASSPLDDLYPHVVSAGLLPMSCPTGARFQRPPSGLYSKQRSVVPNKLFRLVSHSIPSCVFTPSGFSPNTLEHPRAPSAHDLPRHLLVVKTTTGLQRINRCPTLIAYL
jgi:hypothetical protein